MADMSLETSEDVVRTISFLYKAASPCAAAVSTLSHFARNEERLDIGILHRDEKGALQVCSVTGAPHPHVLQHMLQYMWVEPSTSASAREEVSVWAYADRAEDGTAHVTCIALDGRQGALLMSAVLPATFTKCSADAVRYVATTCALTARAISNTTGGLHGECATRGEEEQQRGGQPLLTQRQVTVLGLIAQGLTNPQIARRISYSASTVRMETIAIHRALGVRTRHEAVRVAKERGILTPARKKEEQCKGP